MKIYLLSSRFNGETNLQIKRMLESANHKVHLPSIDTPQTRDMRTHEGNVNGIKNSDAVLAVIKGSVTRNWAYGFGYAQGLNKKIVCIVLGDTDLDEHLMVKLGVDKTKIIHSMKELKDVF